MHIIQSVHLSVPANAMLAQCWPSVVDDGSALRQRRVKLLFYFDEYIGYFEYYGKLFYYIFITITIVIKYYSVIQRKNSNR